MSMNQIWCPERDSNPYGLRRLILNQVCLPIPPPGRYYGASCWILTSVGILSTSVLQTATFEHSDNDALKIILILKF